MEYTSNYHLPRWEMADRIRMEDFNDMTSELEKALTEEREKREETDAVVSRKGNCELWFGSYKGTGLHGESNPCRLTFPKKPLLVIVLGWDGYTLMLTPDIGRGTVHAGNVPLGVSVKWEETGVSWYYSGNPTCQMNEKGKVYCAFAFIPMDV